MTIKVGYILDNEKADQSNYEIIQWMCNEDIELTCLINQVPMRSFSQKFKYYLKRVGDRGFSRILLRINKFAELFSLSKRDRTLITKKINVKSYFKKTFDVTPNISKSGLVYRYRDDQINKIKAENLDLIIRGGSGILKGDILLASKFGILSFHHANNQVNRGGPAGFWEVFHRNPKSGFTIQILTEELDGGRILKRGEFLTQRLWLQNYANLLDKSNFYMKNILEFFIKNRTFPPHLDNVPYSMPLYQIPSLFKIFSYQLKSFQLILKIIIEKVLNINFSWSVRYQYKSWNNLVMWKSREIANPKGTFLADPFIVKYGKTDFIFVEEYVYSKKRGHISVLQVEDEQPIYLGKILEENFHLSYPMIFEYKNNFYMVPETGKKRSIRLYKCMDFPLKWGFEKTIMSHVDAADATIFPYENKWWMLVNIDPAGRNDHCSELFAFWSEDPTSDKWIPHKLNPLIINPAKARMGGLFKDGEQIYRVAQCQGFNMYGEKSIIYNIKELTIDKYEEEKVCANHPQFSEDILGTHHMHSNSNLTVFDCVSKKFRFL